MFLASKNIDFTEFAHVFLLGGGEDAVFFVDAIFALAVFVAQRDQRLRDPLTGIDEDLAVLGSLGKILLLHVATSIKIHPDQVLSALEALEQIALQVPAIDGFPDHIFLLLVPHGIVQHLLQHTQCPQFSGTHIAQKGTVVAAVSSPIFLLPAGVAGGAVDQLVQFSRSSTPSSREKSS